MIDNGRTMVINETKSLNTFNEEERSLRDVRPSFILTWMWALSEQREFELRFVCKAFRTHLHFSHHHNFSLEQHNMSVEYTNTYICVGRRQHRRQPVGQIARLAIANPAEQHRLTLAMANHASHRCVHQRRRLCLTLTQLEYQALPASPEHSSVTSRALLVCCGG